MAEFITDLFQSIFTPGPTSSLLIATNVAFACLQLLLALLLWATRSIHFAILSFLCGALWWAINWFVTELKLQQLLDDDKKRRLKGEKGGEEEQEEGVIEVEGYGEGSKEVEVVKVVGEVRERPVAATSGKGLEESGTEDEWEKVSENENEKDK